MITLMVLHLFLSCAPMVDARLSPITDESGRMVGIVCESTSIAIGPVPAPARIVRPEEYASRPISKWWHVASFVAAEGDIAATSRLKQSPGFYEINPAMRPLATLPTAEYVVSASAFNLGLNLLADRLNRSERFHRFARPLLAAQIAGNLAGIAYSAGDHHHHHCVLPGVPCAY